MVNNYFGIYVQSLLAKNTVSTLQKQLKAIKDLQIQVTPTFGKINKSEISRINSDLKKQLAEAQKDSKLDITPSVDSEKLKETTKAVSDVGKSLKKDLSSGAQMAGKELGSFGQQAELVKNVTNNLLGIIGKVAVWGIATNAIYGTKRALKEMFEEYVKIEDSLVSISR